MSGTNPIGQHSIWRAKPENFTPPTNNPLDCVCGAKSGSQTVRLLIPNCPCCDGVQVLTEELCNCTTGHPLRVVLPPNSTMRIRYIDTIEAIQ